MQIVESSVIGLRSARLRLVSDTTMTQITLFPMVHVGDPAFFQQVEDEARTQDIVLLEGVRGRVARRLTRVYRWAGVWRLGLVVQPSLVHLTNARRADLSATEFEAAWSRIPVLSRVFFATAAGLSGLWLRVTGSRTHLARGMSVDDLTSREDHLALAGDSAPLLWALSGARDAHLITELDAALNEAPECLAVVYGASHMPAVLRHLRKAHGYTLAGSDWMTVFTADQ